MATIYLHIGMHKTGSTAIQQSFDAGRAAALAHGVDYPLAGRHPSAAVNEAFGRTEADFDADPAQKRARAALAERLAASTAPKMLLSAEALDRYRDRRGGALRVMLEGLGGEVRVIVYLREPVSWAASQAQQHIKQGRVTLDDLRRDPGQQGRRRGHSVVPAYRDVLEAWLGLYGRERLDIRVYDRARFAGGSLIHDICAAIGEPALAAELPDLRINESLSAEAVRLADAYVELERKGVVEPDRDLLERLRAVPGRRFRLPDDIAAMVLRETAADRAWLRETFAIDLTPAEPEPQDPTAWSDPAVETLVTMLATRKPPSPLASLAALFRPRRKTKRS